jgi:hypothetical protein
MPSPYSSYSWPKASITSHVMFPSRPKWNPRRYSVRNSDRYRAKIRLKGYVRPDKTARFISTSHEHWFAPQVHPPPSISHPLHASNQSLAPYNLHHLILVDFVEDA